MARSGAALDVIARGAPYLLSPQTLYDCLVDVPKLVFPSSALFDWTTTRLAIYYVGADTATALTFGYLEEVVDFVKTTSQLFPKFEGLRVLFQRWLQL
jgi:beta-1,4-mannooligosaccharide/beta-1,4-mannosyl-N-acetylglucosamine phosphorylase